MNWLAYLPLVFVVTACGTPANAVVPLGGGLLRAPTYAQAAAYCERDGSTARMLRKAPAETGVEFECR